MPGNLDALLAAGRRASPTSDPAVQGCLRPPSAQGRTTDIDRYLSEHGQLDAALAETAALAADDVLLDDLLTDLEVVPHARALLLGASVYRRAVDHHALAYQLGSPDPNSANTAAVQAARQAIQDILARAQIPPGPVDLAQLPAQVQAVLGPHLAVLLTPPVRVEVNLAPLIGACAASSLLTATTPRGQARVFVHRWTAGELHRREHAAGTTAALRRAHQRAADYWRWRVEVWPQPDDQDIEDLREAHHHYQQALTLDDTSAAAELATTAWHLELRLAKLGRRAEALTYCQQAVALKRDLVLADEATHIRDLAGFLSNLGIRLSKLGRREEALTVATEAVEVRLRLAAADPAAFEPDLASSLNNLGAMLSELGRREEALTVATEAVEVRRRLAAASPAAFEPDLASSLNNLGATVVEVGAARGGADRHHRGRRGLPAVGRGQPCRVRTRPRPLVEQPRHRVVGAGAAGEALAPPTRPSRCAGGWPRPTLPRSNPTSPVVEQPRRPVVEAGSAGGGAGRRPRRPSRSTGGWPRPTLPPSNPTSPAR